MPLNLGDAFLTFRGDLTQLNLAFDQTAQSANKLAPAQAKVDALGEGFDRAATQAEAAAAAMVETGRAAQSSGSTIQEAWLRVAKATSENARAQNELGKALFAVKSTGGESAEAINRLAVAQQKAGAASVELGTAREAAMALGNAAHGAGEKTSESMERARDSVDLLGDQLGIRIPRELKGVIAALPGVRVAMDAAFSAIAVVGIISLIVEATQKVYEWAKSFHELSEEEKKALDNYADEIKKAEERTQKLIDLEHERILVGKTEEEQARLTAQWAKASADSTEGELVRVKRQYEEAKKIKELFEQGAQVQIGADYGADPTGAVPIFGDAVSNEQMKQAEATIHRLEALYGEGLKDLEDKSTIANANIAVTTAEQLQKQLELRIKHGESAINADKLVDDALLAQSEAQAQAWAAVSQNSYFEQGRLQARFAEDRYQLERETLVKLRDLAALDPRNEDKVRDLNAKIVALDAKRNTELLNQETTFLKQVNAAIAGQQAEFKNHHEEGFVPFKIELSEAGKDLVKLQDAFKQLGIRGSASWTQLVVDAQDAFDKIVKFGGTAADKLAAEMKIVEAKIGEALAGGDIKGADAESKRLAKLQAEWAHLTGAVRANRREIDLWHNSSTRRLLSVSDAMQHLADRGAKSLDLVVDALESAIAQAILGQESFGRALEKALAQQLAAWAAQDAISAVRQTALGFALLAVMDFEGAANAFESAAIYASIAAVEGGTARALNPKDSGGSSGFGNDFNDGTGSPVQTTAPVDSGNITPVTNVQRFATGSLVTAPTLAVIGDSITGASRAAAEAVIPLEDPRALRSIGGAIAQHMPGGVGGNIHITLESDIVQTVRRIDHAVQNNGVKLTASNAMRVTKKA